MPQVYLTEGGHYEKKSLKSAAHPGTGRHPDSRLRQLGGGDRYLVRVPVDGSKQEKLNYELQPGYEYYTALRGDTLYILELDQSSDGNTSVIRYDLIGNTVMDRTTLRLPLSRALYMGVEPDWYFGSWNSATGNGNATTTDLYQIHSDLIQGDGEPVKLVDRLATINGAVHTVYGHYAVYQGDYETIPVDDPLGIAENEVYAQSRHTYLMNLETGDQFLLDQDYRYLNFFPDGLLITGTGMLAGGTEVDPFRDHRIAMAAALAACICRNPVTIKDAECVSKSYPDFFKDFTKLGGKADVI